ALQLSMSRAQMSARMCLVFVMVKPPIIWYRWLYSNILSAMAHENSLDVHEMRTIWRQSGAGFFLDFHAGWQDSGSMGENYSSKA
ncbi:hypothetical protein, partial [Mitsuokella multacida]|uniref:hypothetical protein n=1 Tax=Mitsuokella multacida TaxID=52226 RepID=UPI003F823B5B